MMCFLCGKEISWLRSMVDRQYCSAEHRKEARLASANALREEDEEHEIWSVENTRKKTRGNPSGQTASVFAFLTLGVLLVAMLMLPGNAVPRGSAFPTGSTDPGTRQGLFERATSSVGELVRDSAPVTLHQDFRTGLGDWTVAALKNTTHVDDPHDWKIPSAPTLIAPGSLRIWDRSTKLQNYQMEFQGQLEGRSLSWAFRAADGNNYYASKLVIAKPGANHNAGLVRYAMVDGHEKEATRLPLPLSLARGVDYRVRMTVQDDHFITYLNGQVISSWTDSVLKRGGVGFFEDQNDPQSVSWISVSERDSFMGRMLAHFSLFVIPGR